MSRHFLALYSFIFKSQQQLLAVSDQTWWSRAGCCIGYFNRVLYCHISVQYSRTTLWLLYRYIILLISHHGSSTL